MPRQQLLRGDLARSVQPILHLCPDGKGRGCRRFAKGGLRGNSFDTFVFLKGRVRECLVNLLTTCGQRVGLPKSPSVSRTFHLFRFSILSILV